MSIPRILLGAALVAAFSMPLVAQQQTTGYYEVACVKVNQGQSAAFHAFFAGTAYKLEQELVNSGRIQTGLMLHTVLPQGAHAAECDYVFVEFFKGLPPKPMTMKEMSKALHDAGLSMTPKEFYAQRSEVATLVNANISQSVANVGEAKRGDYLVLNEMAAPDIGACLSYEKKMWQPLAEEMVKTGDTAGWGTEVQIFPWGARDGYRVSSVDIYPSWDAFLNSYQSDETAWKTVHPDVDINSALAQFSKLCPIEHTVLSKVVGIVTPKQ